MVYQKFVILITVCLLSPGTEAALQEIRSGSFSYSIGAAPDWVVDPGKLSMATKGHTNRPIKYHLISKQVKVGEKTQEYTRIAAETLTLSGVENMSKVQINFHNTKVNLCKHINNNRR